MKRNSSSKNKRPRVYAFIDAENMRNAAEAYDYFDLDYEKMYFWLKKKRGVSKIFIYAAIEQGDVAKEQRYLKLNRPDCQVNLKTVVAYKQPVWLLSTTCPHCKQQFIRKTYIKDKKKANCDAELTLDLVRLVYEKKYDKAIIFSGDGDFCKVYNFLVTEKHIKITVYSPIKKGIKITSTKVKEMASSGMIKLEDLGCILFNYGLKQIVVS